MLEHLGEMDAAKKLEQAVAAVLKEGENVTADLKGKDSPTPAVGTRAMGEAIVEKIRSM